MGNRATHPAVDQLAAFGYGKETEAESAEIADHLAGCATCQQVVETLPDDALLRLIRHLFQPGHAPASTQIDSWVPPELVNHARYRLLAWLGAGGMGVVYKAEHKLMERTVALKVVSKALTANSAAVERFKKEVKAAARLSHPNIVTAYDAEQAGDLHFLVMEFVEGVSLARVVEEKGPLPVEVACEYVRQAALGLQNAFEAGMVHRDIKPQNLMLTPKGEIKILDFGLAGFVREGKPGGSLTGVGEGLGTPDYIAPEQIRDAHSADIRADIYSLGCTLYFLLTGQVPFAEGSVLQKISGHLERSPRPVKELRGDVPEEVVQVVERMMTKEPAQRYQTPREVVEGLGKGPKQYNQRLLPWLIGIGLVAVLLCVLCGYIIIKVRTKTGTVSVEINQPDTGSKQVIKVQVEQDIQETQRKEPSGRGELKKKIRASLSTKQTTGPSAEKPLVILQSRTWSWPGSRWNYAKCDGLTFEVGMGNDYTGNGDAGVEIEEARRLRVTVDSSPVFTKYDQDSFAGFMVDYHTPKGYVLRVALSMAFSSPTRKVKTPIWGKRSVPDRFVNIETKKEYVFALAKWAPLEWDGRVWFTLTLQNSGSNTWMRAKVSQDL